MIETLRLFGREYPTSDKVPFDQLNKRAVLYGYLVADDACTKETEQFIFSKNINYNATFYKKWNDVISKSRWELFVDQMKHYTSTYGSAYSGETYVPNDGATDVPEFTDLKVITTITKEEVTERVLALLSSGIALKEETLYDIISIIEKLKIDVDLSKVKNKEAKIMLYIMLSITPEDPEDLVRVLVYLATNSTLLIKSKIVIEDIMCSNVTLKGFINDSNIKRVAEVFHRYKPIFLAFKKNRMPGNKEIVNKLRRLADKYHKPKEPSFWSTALINGSIYDVMNNLSSLNSFKKIALIEELDIREVNPEFKGYVIRNQKLWVKEGKTYDPRPTIRRILFESLIADLAKKKCKVKLPEHIELVLPRSEKSFIGNIPMFSYVNISEADIILGIYWKNEWGARDLDLSFNHLNGTKVGWNASFYDGTGAMFSGDMTNADPEAVELVYLRKGCDSTGLLKVNLYNGEPNSGFKFFVAKEKIVKMERNYMVNPNNILLSVDDKMDSSEKVLGITADSKFYFATLRTGKGMVSTHNTTDCYSQYTLDIKDCHLNLRDVLVKAGFEIVDKDPDIDFSDLSKDTIISLLS